MVGELPEAELGASLEGSTVPVLLEGGVILQLQRKTNTVCVNIEKHHVGQYFV